jgi:hypothetical protein
VRGRGVFGRFRYNDLKGAAVIAADAGPMQIEWSGGVAWRCAGVVRRSTTADTMREKVGCGEKILLRERVKNPEEEIGSAIRRKATDRAETRSGFVISRVVSCGSGDHRWRTKLHLGSR